MSCPTGVCCPTVDCNDNYSILIQAILNLGGDIGPSLDEIIQEVPNVCPHAQMDVEATLLAGIRRGIFGWGSTSTYVVRSDMIRLNSANAIYWRRPGCPGSFYIC